MLAIVASRCEELHFTVLTPTKPTKIPRCLFGSPNSKDTAKLLKDTLEMERTRFQSRWGIDPASENEKENILSKYEKVERSPRKKTHPYNRQANMHEFWRPRKVHEMHKKTSNVLEPTNCNLQSPKNDMKGPTTLN